MLSNGPSESCIPSCFSTSTCSSNERECSFPNLPSSTPPGVTQLQFTFGNLQGKKFYSVSVLVCVSSVTSEVQQLFPVCWWLRFLCTLLFTSSFFFLLGFSSAFLHLPFFFDIWFWALYKLGKSALCHVCCKYISRKCHFIILSFLPSFPPSLPPSLPSSLPSFPEQGFYIIT